MKVAFIGAGNMAFSLIKGLIARDFDPSTLRAADPAPEQLARLQAMQVATFANNAEAIADADVIVLAIKPQLAAQVAGSLTPLDSRQLVVSIMAGINLDSLAAWFTAEQPIVRCMPNTPALLGAGITGLYANSHVSEAMQIAAQAILDAAGTTLWLDNERQLDAVTAVSGSGPAYFFYLMESMINAGKELGLSAEVSRQLTIKTALGAALMADAPGSDPAKLRANVTSPGGTTASALIVMEDKSLDKIVSLALAAGYRRANELASEFGE